jgi:hypothetical protein
LLERKDQVPESLVRLDFLPVLRDVAHCPYFIGKTKAATTIGLIPKTTREGFEASMNQPNGCDMHGQLYIFYYTPTHG